MIIFKLKSYNPIYLLLLMIFISTGINGQITGGAGAYLGGGVIRSNSPSQASFTSSIFAEKFLFPADYISARLSFIYSADFNSIIPGSRLQYNPSVLGVSLKGIYSSYFTYEIFLEQGLGFAALNDRIYRDRNNWDFGMIVSLLGGIDFRKNTFEGFRIGIGVEYGLTFINSSIHYSSLHFEAQYIF
jgi:hypothetical protein